MAQYQHPKDKGRVVEVGENEGAKRRMLERLGWKLAPQGQEAQPAPKAEKAGKQTAKTTDSPKPLNVKAEPTDLRGVDVQPKPAEGKAN